MAFALTTNLITQTGTDANLSGIAGIAGVTTKAEGSGAFIKTRYYIPNGTSLTYDNLTIDPKKECLIFGTTACLLQAGSNASILTIGANISQSGGNYSHLSEAIIFGDNSGNAYQVTSGFKVTQGTLNWYSGIIRGQNCFGIGATQYDNSGATATLSGYIGPYATLEIMVPPSGQSNESCQMQVAGHPSFKIDGCVVKGYGTVTPSSLISIATNTTYINPPVFKLEGCGGITSQYAQRINTFSNFYGLQTNGAPKGFNMFLGSLIRGVNQIQGSNTIIVEHNVDPNHCQGYVELRNEVDLTFKNSANSPILGVVTYCKDTNNGFRKNYTLNSQTLNNIPDKVYIGSSDASGNLKFTGLAGSIVTCVVANLSTGTVSGVDDSGGNKKDYRSVSGLKGVDDFLFHYWSYGNLYQNSLEILKSDKVAKFVAKTMLVDASVTLSETNAIAKLASSFTVSGNTLTVTANSTLDNVYDVMKAYKTRPIQAQLEYPTIDTLAMIEDGTNLITAMSVVVNSGVVLSGGSKFKSITPSASITITGNALSNITIVGSVIQTIPTNLTNVTITGTLTYNTASNTNITYTGSTLATVNNSGAGVVTVKRVASSLTTGTNVVAYLPTTLIFTLNSGRIRVLDNVGTEQYNQTSDGTFELPSSATGTWTYKIVKYGSQPIISSVTIDGTVKSITASYIPDTFVVDTLSNVTAYTSLGTVQKVYDYYSYYLTTVVGIVVTKNVTLTASLLDLGNNKLSNTTLGVVGNIIGTNTGTVSGVNILTSVLQTGITPTYPQKITDSASTTNWVQITLNGGRIRILDNVGTEQYNQTTDGNLLIPSSATGTWTYKIVKYGSQPITGSFNIDGTLKSITASYIPDSFVVDTLTNVQAYTSLGTVQKIYDYYSYYLSTATGILVTKGITLTASLLNLGVFTLSNTALSVSSNVIGINTSTISGLDVTTTGTQTGITPSYPQRITDASTSTNWVQVTLNGGRIRILDNTSTEQYNQTTDGNILLPSSSTGAWTYKIVKYGSNPVFGAFNIDGTLKSINATYIPDATVVDTLSNVSAYTSLGNSQKIYDWYSYYLTTLAGIRLTKSVSITSNLLTLGAYTLANSTVAITGNVIGINTPTVSGVSLTTTGTQTGITVTYPQQLTDSTGTTNWLSVVLTSGQVCRDTYDTIYHTASYNTFIPASYVSPIDIYVTRVGYKKQVVTIPFSTVLYSTRSFTLIPDSNVLDVVTDFTSATLSNSQNIYDAFSQYQASSSGILDTYTLSKAPGSIDFTSKGFELSTINDFTVNPIKIKTTNLVTDTYYSASNFVQGSATLGTDVKIRASNLDSELVYTADSVTFYPTVGDRNASTNPGITITGGIYRYKFGSVYTGVTMTNPTNIRYTTGVTISLGSLPLTTGNYIFSLTPTELIIQTNNNLRLVNQNVIKTSLFIPASQVF